MPPSSPLSEVERIADQFQRAFAGEAWHGPSLTELVGNVTSKEAAAHPAPGAHSIWEVLLHITAWKQLTHRRLMGEAVELSSAEDWPAPVGSGPNAWNEVLRGLHAAQRQLRQDLAKMPEPRLQEQVPGKDYNVYFMLQGLLQHDLYHAGQIALLKRSLRSG